MAHPITAGQVRVPPTPPVARNTDKDFFPDILLSFFKERVKDIAKGVGYGIFWTTQAIPTIPEPVKEFGGWMRDLKNFISITEIPEKLYKVVKSAKDFFDKPSIPTGRTAVKENMGLANALLDTVELLGGRHILPLGKEALKYFGAANHAATLVGSGIGAYENYDKIDRAGPNDEAKVGLWLINLARDVSYVALGVFGLFCFFAGLAAAPFYPVVMVACLTSALTFSIGGYFYERIVNPEGKQADSSKVIANLQDQNRYLQNRLTAAGA
jgi:hypothetical protein